MIVIDAKMSELIGDGNRSAIYFPWFIFCVIFELTWKGSKNTNTCLCRVNLESTFVGEIIKELYLHLEIYSRSSYFNHVICTGKCANICLTNMESNVRYFYIFILSMDASIDSLKSVVLPNASWLTPGNNVNGSPCSVYHTNLVSILL